MNHCINMYPDHLAQTFRDCNHDETQHDENGCQSCDCPVFKDEAWLEGQEEPTGGGHNDSDPTYRRAMEGAGRSIR